MLSTLSRFRGHNSLNSVYKYGKTINANQISFKYLKIQSDKPARIAVVVSRKVNKRAVVRNKIRRRIYEELRQKTKDQSLNSDLVIIIYSDIYATMSTPDLIKTLDQLLNKSQVIEKK